MILSKYCSLPIYIVLYEYILFSLIEVLFATNIYCSLLIIKNISNLLTNSTALLSRNVTLLFDNIKYKDDTFIQYGYIYYVR